MIVENLFEYLRRKDGSKFDQGTIENWYKARAYVLDKLKDVAIGPESNEHLHVVVHGDSGLMLSVVRQVALSAHYANFDEATGKSRTVVTLVGNRDDIVQELYKEECLCNLLNHCRYTVGGTAMNPVSCIGIDLEFEILKDGWTKGENEILVEMKEEEITQDEGEVGAIDTSKAVLASRMYNLGSFIDNLPAEDIHCASRYMMALDVFRHDYLNEPVGSLLDDENEWENNSAKVKEGLSNVFCTDCFESRKKGIDLYYEAHKKDLTEKEAWENNNEALSKSEHARWVVEKLIMGFRPLNDEERWADEQKFGMAKKRYRKELKKKSQDPAHIDLCSYADLRRVNPEDMKYDSFLMLAIPAILKKLGIK